MGIVCALAVVGAVSVCRFLLAERKSYRAVRRAEREAAEKAKERAKREAERKERLRWN